MRRYLAKQANLLGAVRLSNNVLKANAGTEVTTDILFFQKCDRTPERLPEWVKSGLMPDGVPLNRYFFNYPEVLGKISFWENMYSNKMETACLPIEGENLSQQLTGVVQNLALPNRELLEMTSEQEDEKEMDSLPADPSENSHMELVSLGKTPTERAKGMMAIRDSA